MLLPATSSAWSCPELTHSRIVCWFTLAICCAACGKTIGTQHRHDLHQASEGWLPVETRIENSLTVEISMRVLRFIGSHDACRALTAPQPGKAYASAPQKS